MTPLFVDELGVFSWPACPTADCENLQCTWAETGLCHPCSVRLVGMPEMIRRWDATHDVTWEEAKEDGDEADG